MPWTESYDQPRQYIKKQWHYFVNKGPSSQGYGFSSSHVWIWELDYKESWVLKNWWFELWCWRRLLRVPWTARRSNQSILKETSPGCSLEGLMLKLKLQYFGNIFGKGLTHLKWPWCWKRLRAGGEGDNRGWDGWLASPTQWTWVWVDSGSWWWTGRPSMLWFMGSQRVGHDWVAELNWIFTCVYVHCFLFHSPADGHLGCFHVLAIVNSAVMNIGVHMSLSILVSSVCMPSSEASASNHLNMTLFLENWLQDAGATLAGIIESVSFLGV